MIHLPDFPEPPPDLIAQAPLPQRDAARLLALNRTTDAFVHRTFHDLPAFFRPGDVLVLNDVRVFPARLVGVKPTGGKVKMLLLERNAAGDRWTSLLTPAQRSGARLRVHDADVVVETKRESGEYELSFSRPLSEEDLSRWGRMPLPPYIRRSPADPTDVEATDRVYYQTVYSTVDSVPSAAASGLKAPGAVAAPTAGLHFTPELLDRLASQGTEIRRLRLDVGWGTFRPIRGDFTRHKMMEESFFIPDETAEAVNRAKAEKRRVWAVGTTVVRTLEGACRPDGRIPAGPGSTGLYITPGFSFRVADALVTNFHLRDHTPLLLTAAFAGPDFLLRAYTEAVRERYRFLSYGDGMVVF